MSRWHLQQAWDLSVKLDLSASERCVLMAIASHINGRSGQWRIGIHKIAEEAGVNQSYCRRVIASLRRKGVLHGEVSGLDRACTWWIPMIAAMPTGAESAQEPARKARTDQREERAPTSAPDAQDPSAKTAHNTRDTSLSNYLGENLADLSNVERSFLEAFVQRGDQPERALGKVLQMRPKKEAV